MDPLDDEGNRDILSAEEPTVASKVATRATKVTYDGTDATVTQIFDDGTAEIEYDEGGTEDVSLEKLSDLNGNLAPPADEVREADDLQDEAEAISDATVPGYEFPYHPTKPQSRTVEHDSIQTEGRATSARSAALPPQVESTSARSAATSRVTSQGVEARLSGGRPSDYQGRHLR